jgi:hypothetical protein
VNESAKRISRCISNQFLLWVASTVLWLSVLVLQPTAAASQTPVQKLSAALRKNISEAKLKSVAVADFVTPDGTVSGAGIYFADILHLYLDEGPKKFHLVGRDSIARSLDSKKIEAAGPKSPEVLARIGEALGVDAIVTGTVGIWTKSK